MRYVILLCVIVNIARALPQFLRFFSLHLLNGFCYFDFMRKVLWFFNRTTITKKISTLVLFDVNKI